MTLRSLSLVTGICFFSGHEIFVLLILMTYVHNVSFIDIISPKNMKGLRMPDKWRTVDGRIRGSRECFPCLAKDGPIDAVSVCECL